jgi:uncharacterized protein YjbI with pentapeptide repeats
MIPKVSVSQARRHDGPIEIGREMPSKLTQTMRQHRLELLVVFVVAAGLLGASACRANAVMLQGHLTVATESAGPGVEVAIFDSTEQTEVSRTFTDEHGDYEFRAGQLPNGSYRIRFSSASWWDGAATWADATPVTVTSDAPTRIDSEIAAPDAGSASGIVSRTDGQPIHDVVVDAINTETGDTIAVADASTVDGAWQLPTLPPGPYRFRARSGDQPSGLTARYNGSTPSSALAPTIEITSGGAVGDIQIVLDPESVLTGRLTDGVAPVSAAKVIAVGSDGLAAAEATSDADGRFAIHGLDAVDYHLVVIDVTKQFRVTNWAASSTAPPTVFSLPSAATSDAGTLALRAWDCDPATFTTGANLNGADLDGLQLRGCDLSAVDLAGSSMVGTNLTNAKLTGTDLSTSHLDNTILAGADLGTAVLTGVESHGIVGTPRSLPPGWSLIDGSLVFSTTPTLDWQPAALAFGAPLGANQLNATASMPGSFSYTPAAGSLLTVGAHTLSTTFTPTDPQFATVTTTVQISVVPASTTTELAISGDGNPATLTATVQATAPSTAVPIGTVTFFDGTSSLGSKALDGLGQASITVTLPAGVHSLSATFNQGPDFASSTGTLAAFDVSDHCTSPGAPGVDWSGCDLGTRDLTDANLAGANLTGANLSGTTLTGVSSGNIIGTPSALPTNWQLVGGYLLGPDADLAGVSLRFVNIKDGVDLSGADLSGADLWGFVLWNGNLSGANLTGANLTYADIRYTPLTNATITNANLESVALLYDDLTGVVSGGLVGTPFQVFTTPEGFWRVLNGQLVNAVTDLSLIDFTNSDLRGSNFSGYDLTEVDFSGSDLSASNLSGATVTGADFRTATLTGVSSGGIVGTPVGLPVSWHLSGGYLLGPTADLSGANLTGFDLSSFDLSGANLTGATLTNANLSGTSLLGANFTGIISGGIVGVPASLPTDWALGGGYLFGAGADLHGKDLAGADLSDVDLHGTNFAGADLTNVDFTGSNLSGSSFVGATVTGTTFLGADLTAIQSGGMVGSVTALPPSWAQIDGYFVGPGANLTGADLSGADLTGVELTNSNLTSVELQGADITGTDLTGATLTGVRSGSIAGPPSALPTGWTLVDGYLIGSGADLSGEDLRTFAVRNWNLTGVNLSNANLSGLDLHGLDLTRDRAVNIAGANLTGANLSGASLRFVNIQSGTNFSGADLSGADLWGFVLWNGNLSGANLTGANLTYADIRYTPLTNATITNANLESVALLYDDLTGVVSGGLVGTPFQIYTTPEGSWHVVDGYLVPQ